MHGMSDDILDQIRSREVTGVFHSRKALIAAAEELLVAGFDRADIDVSAPLDELQRRLNYSVIPAAVAMAFFLVVYGMGPIAVGILSVLSGVIVGGVALWWARRRLRRERTMG